MPAYWYEFYLLVVNSISHSFAALTREISSWPLEDKIHIHARACNILYIFRQYWPIIKWWSKSSRHIKLLWGHAEKRSEQFVSSFQANKFKGRYNFVSKFFIAEVVFLSKNKTQWSIFKKRCLHYTFPRMADHGYEPILKLPCLLLGVLCELIFKLIL